MKTATKVIIIFLAVLIAIPFPSGAETLSAAAFLATMGANTHLPYTDGLYSNIPLVISEMKYLGLDQVRDNGPAGSAPISNYVSLAKAGIHFTFVINGEASITSNAGILSELALIDQIERAVPGSITAIEGANEINNFPITYNGQTGIAAGTAMQTDLYADVHADSNLKGVKVDYFTGYDAGGVGLGPDPTVSPVIADFDNQHPYPAAGAAPAPWIARDSALPNLTSKDLKTAPAVYTETGYSTNAASALVQASYSLDLYMDAAADGISKTYLFDLMDAYAPGSPQGDDGYGLFGYYDSPSVGPTAVPKMVADAIHGLTTYLSDTASGAKNFIPKDLAYSVSGLPSTGNSLAVEKSNGIYVLVLWAEPAIWNSSNKSPITPPMERVTVSFKNPYSIISVMDSEACCSAIASYTNRDAVTVSVTDHPVLIALEKQE